MSNIYHPMQPDFITSIGQKARLQFSISRWHQALPKNPMRINYMGSWLIPQYLSFTSPVSSFTCFSRTALSCASAPTIVLRNISVRSRSPVCVWIAQEKQFIEWQHFSISSCSLINQAYFPPFLIRQVRLKVTFSTAGGVLFPILLMQMAERGGPLIMSAHCQTYPLPDGDERQRALQMGIGWGQPGQRWLPW